jgi:hypothetical protein
MRRVRVTILAAGFAGMMMAGVAWSESGGYVPPKGFVPDAATASRIAEAVWIPIYGEENIAKEKPFRVSLRSGVWTVRGKDLPAGWKGGVAEADISKRDGRILRVLHGK